MAPVLVTNGDGGSEDGQVHFSALVRQGALVKGGKTRHGVPAFVGGGDFERLWDACSSTVRAVPMPFLSNNKLAVAMQHACSLPSLSCSWPLGDDSLIQTFFSAPRYIKCRPNNALNNLKCQHGWRWKLDILTGLDLG